MDVGLCIGVCGDRRNYPFIETHAKDNWCMGYLDLIHLSIPSCDHRVVFKLKLKYKVDLERLEATTSLARGWL
jgi:hypothetical protein